MRKSPCRATRASRTARSSSLRSRTAPCVLRGFLPSEDCMRTVQALRACGIKIEQPEPEMLIVHGKRRQLDPPPGDIDCGNSATTMRLLAGLLAGQPFDSRLVGEATLARRPDGSRDRAAASDGRQHRRRRSERDAAVADHGCEPARHRIQLADSKRAGEKRAPARGVVCQREDDGKRALTQPEPHRADAQLLPRPHGEGGRWRHHDFWRPSPGIARLHHPGRYFVGCFLAGRGRCATWRSSAGARLRLERYPHDACSAC